MNYLEHYPYDYRLTRFYPKECCGGSGTTKYEFATINGQSIISGGNIDELHKENKKLEKRIKAIESNA